MEEASSILPRYALRAGNPVHGHLVRRPGGSWALHYDIDGKRDDEAGYHFSDENFVLGEYVSVREEKGMHTYRVTSVEQVR